MTTTGAKPENLLPLTPAVFHVLLALADGERHGYAIMREVTEATDGRIKMGPGTLYGTIKRLLEAKLIEEIDERPDPELDDERRRYYCLTGLGQRVVRAEAERYAQMVELARGKKLIRRPVRVGLGGTAYTPSYLGKQRRSAFRRMGLWAPAAGVSARASGRGVRRADGCNYSVDQCRDAWKRRRIWGVAGLWLRVLPDLVKTAIWERLINRGERKYMFRKVFTGLRSRPALLGVFMAVSFAVFLLVLISSTIITFILPEAYSSRAQVGFYGRLTGDACATAVPACCNFTTSHYVRTEMEVIQSERILDGVIDALDLNTVFAKKFGSPAKLNSGESRALLKAMIEVHPARNTSLVDITIYSDDRMEAAKIANCIAEVYQTYRQNQHEKLLAGSLDKYQQLKDKLKSELADKTSDPKAVDAKITETITRAGEVYQAMNAGVPDGSVEIIERRGTRLSPRSPEQAARYFPRRRNRRNRRPAGRRSNCGNHSENVPQADSCYRVISKSPPLIEAWCAT